MTWSSISPFLAGILTAAAILIVDLIRPGKTAVAVAVALIGLAITAPWRSPSGRRRERRSVAATRSTR